MNTMRKNIAWAFLAALSLTACEKAGDTDNGPVELRLSSSIEVQTKAGHGLDEAFKAGDNVYVWVDDAKDVQTTVAKENLYVAKEMTVQSGGALQGDAMYFPQTGNKVNIYAFHHAKVSLPPAFGLALTYTVEQDQTSEANYAKSDIAFAKSTDVARTTSIVPLKFYHLLSKVEVVLKEGNGDKSFLQNGISKMEILGTYQGASITLNKTTDPDKFTVSTGAAIEAIQIGTDVTPASGPEVLNEAIIVPQKLADKTGFIKITLNSGGEFIYKLDKETTFDSGKKYKYTITANQTGLSVTSSIENWGEGGTATGDATM